ncbi:MAG TPA: class II glutamine amidotransferase [Anaerolineae bacterium]|jgi:glutamine amidotransferase|nr:class II glutamine amidotransferase [Anaerolineae bacterium]
MCRLFGLIADSPVSLENPLLEGVRPFINLSYRHHDGWGIGYLNDSVGERDARVVKAPLAAYQDERFSNLVKHLVSPLVIVHLRDAKYGEVAVKNTHPFYAEGWIFAHNGAIEGYEDIELDLAGVKFEGETDSERYFHLILNRIKCRGDVKEGIFSAIQWLERHQFLGGKNFLMSNGRRLYAYRSGRDLFYTIRKVPSITAGYSKDTVSPDPVVSLRTTKMVIISSETLTDEDWHEVPEDHLLEVDENLKVTIEPIMGKIVACC